MQKGLRQNCEKKVNPAVEVKVRAAEDIPLTFGDFEAALKDIVNGAPQVPPWPLQTWSIDGQRRSANLHIHMPALWQMRETPQRMKDKRPKLAPKVPDMQLISLYEVIRKV
jgi:hypothetical protein